MHPYRRVNIGQQAPVAVGITRPFGVDGQYVHFNAQLRQVMRQLQPALNTSTTAGRPVISEKKDFLGRHEVLRRIYDRLLVLVGWSASGANITQR
jgi:hypothetical protein